MVTFLICAFYVSAAFGAFAYMYDKAPVDTWYGHVAYIFFALTWPFWLPAIIMHWVMRVTMPIFILCIAISPVFAQQGAQYGGGGSAGMPMGSTTITLPKSCIFEIKHGQVKTIDCDMAKFFRNPVIKMIGNNETTITFDQVDPYVAVGGGGGGVAR